MLALLAASASPSATSASSTVSSRLLPRRERTLSRSGAPTGQALEAVHRPRNPARGQVRPGPSEECRERAVRCSSASPNSTAMIVAYCRRTSLVIRSRPFPCSQADASSNEKMPKWKAPGCHGARWLSRPAPPLTPRRSPPVPRHPEAEVRHRAYATFRSTTMPARRRGFVATPRGARATAGIGRRRAVGPRPRITLLDSPAPLPHVAIACVQFEGVRRHSLTSIVAPYGDCR